MIKLFREKKINDYFTIVGRNILKKAENINEYEILNDEIKNIATKSLASFKLKNLSIDLKNRTVNSEMINIPAEKFPRNYDVRRGEKYPCAKVSYTYNLLSNNIELLSVSPSKITMDKIVEASIGQKSFTIHYQTLHGNINLSDEAKKEIKNWAISIEKQIVEIVKNINEEIDIFNLEIFELFKKALEDRKQKIILKKKQDNDLNDF